MTVTLTDWLTIAAIILGPILALAAQRALDRLRETRKPPRGTFLHAPDDATSPLAHEHVRALNAIDVVFLKDSDRPIREARQRVREQMSLNPARPNWSDRLNDLQCDLLQRMGGELGFPFPVDYLKREGYLPRHYTDLEQDQLIGRV